MASVLNLSKGDNINLRKTNGSKLINICMGLDWAPIKRSFFSKENVDLDASCSCFDTHGNLLETIYYGKKSSHTNGFISHSGDDLTGNGGGSDKDNEVISLDLSKASEDIDSIWFYLNSYSGQDFGEIPHVSLRIYEGFPDKIGEIFSEMKLHNDSNFYNKKAVILAKIHKKDGDWQVEAIGETISDNRIGLIVKSIQKSYY